MRRISVLILGCAFAAGMWAQEGLQLSPAQTQVSENFDGMGADLTLPTAWRVQACSDGPRSVGSYASALTAVHFTGGPNLASNQKNGTYNFYDSADENDRAVGGISTNAASGNNTRGTNVYVQLYNAGAEAINTLTLDYDVEKYRKGSNAAGFTVRLYYSSDGTDWNEAGDDFKVMFSPDTETAGAAVVPIVTSSVSGKKLSVAVDAGENIYLAWNISSTSGTDCASAMALAIDNVTIAATFGTPDETKTGLPISKTQAQYTERFDGMADGIDMPDNWRVQANSEGPRVIGQFSSASASVHFTGGPNLASNQKNGVYNFYDSADESDRAVGGISTNAASGNNTRGTNVYLQLLNTDDEVLNQLTLSYDVEKYRKGSNAAGFAVQLYYSPDGKTWTSAGDDFKLMFSPDAETAGAEIVPIAAETVSGKVLPLAVEPGENVYLAWNISSATGTDCASAMALAIDNVMIQAQFGSVAIEKTLSVMPAKAVLVPEVPEKVRLVSMNNSLIQRNEQWTIFNRMAEAMGVDATWTDHTMLGQTLMTHYNSADARPLIEGTAWTHVILQEHSSLPRTDFATFRENVKVWVDFIRSHCPNPNAIIMLPVNWGFNENGFAAFTDQQTTLLENYTRVAQEFGVSITPVGLAYQHLYDDKGAAWMEAMYTDNRHPSAKATYLAACMEYAMIYGVDATTITYQPRNLEADEAAELRQYAQQALAEYAQVVDHHRRTVTFSSVVTDQFGNVIDAVEPFVYSVSGGGTMEENLFLSDGTCGDFVVNVVRDADAEGSATVSVVANATDGIAVPYSVSTRDESKLRIVAYTLQGIPCSNASQKGVYIINGKKVLR